MKQQFKNALRLLSRKSLTEEEKFVRLSVEEKLGVILGKYFYERQVNNSRECTAMFMALQEVVEQKGDDLSEAWEYAYRVIADFRENEAKVKGWK